MPLLIKETVLSPKKSYLGTRKNLAKVYSNKNLQFVSVCVCVCKTHIWYLNHIRIYLKLSRKFDISSKIVV